MQYRIISLVLATATLLQGAMATTECFHLDTNTIRPASDCEEMAKDLMNGKTSTTKTKPYTDGMTDWVYMTNRGCKIEMSVPINPNHDAKQGASRKQFPYDPKEIGERVMDILDKCKYANGYSTRPGKSVKPSLVQTGGDLNEDWDFGTEYEDSIKSAYEPKSKLSPSPPRPTSQPIFRGKPTAEGPTLRNGGWALSKPTKRDD